MAANVVGVSLTLDDGTNLADRVNPRLVELTLSEKREGEADELALTLQNADGQLAMPARGRTLSLHLGWQRGDEVIPGLIDKGSFVVDEVGASGPPDKITIRARSANLTGAHRRRRTRSWTDTTLGSVLGQIASEAGGIARVESALANRPVTAIEQEGKSDMQFLRDLGRRYDAVATWKGGVLLFLPIGGSASAGGTPLPGITLVKQNGWDWSFSASDRDNNDGASAQWHDGESGRRRTVNVGGDNRRRLERVYATEVEARQAAEAAQRRSARGSYTFTYDLALADCEISPDQRVTLSGWGSLIDGIAWLVESVETTLAGQGLRQRLTLEGTA